MDEAAVLKRLQLVDMAKGKFDSIPNYNLEFKPWWSLSETEQADANQKKAATELTKAQTVQIYADLQVLDASEIRSKLAESEEFTINDILDDEEEEDWNEIESNSESEEIREEFGINVAELIPVTVINEMPPEYCPSQVFLCTEYYGTPIAFNTEMQDARFEAVTDIMKMDLFLPFKLSLVEFINQLKQNGLTFEESQSNISIYMDGGPGSGRYPRGSGKKGSKKSRTKKKKSKSLPMTAKEKVKVTHDINNIYHAKYEGKSFCYIRTHSNEPDSPAYVYRFRNNGFDNYDIYMKESID